MALHTSGDLLNWHPHSHVIALNGVVADDGAFLALQDVDCESMTICFRDKDTLPEPSVVYFKQQDDGDERYRTFSPAPALRLDAAPEFSQIH